MLGWLGELTKPNTYSTINTPASLRSDRCSTSGRNPVRLASGIVFDFVGIAIWPLEVRWESLQSPQPPLIDCQDKTTTSGAIQKDVLK
jgi:hypothetical protein